MEAHENVYHAIGVVLSDIPRGRPTSPDRAFIRTSAFLLPGFPFAKLSIQGYLIFCKPR